MSNKIYAGSLSCTIDDRGLELLFATYGRVSSAHVIIDRSSGRSKGFGFVEMDNNTEAQSAIDGLNGKHVDGKLLIVNKSQPKQANGVVGKSRGGAFGGLDRSRSGGRRY